MTESDTTPNLPRTSPIAYAAFAMGWFVPGFGHLVLRRWGRALVLFLCVGGLAVAGYSMRGQVYALRGGDIFSVLGHLAEIGSGAFYFLARSFEPRGADVARDLGDFGTKFLVTAGLLNYLCMLDAWEIARKKKD